MSYEIFLEPEIHSARHTLPGNIRQRFYRAINALADNPYPPKSRPLDLSGLAIPEGVVIYRLRLEHWRLIYAVNDLEKWIRIIGLYRRPPYDYENLAEIVEKV